MGGTVVCGVNESRGARDAARVAGALSEQLELRLVLAYVVDGFTGAEGTVGDDESVTTMQARQGGKRLLDRLAAEQRLNGADQRIEVGDPAERLAEIAAEERAALILVGARAQGRRWRPMLRSDLSRDLARVTSCPVLVVPPGTDNPSSRDSLALGGD
jgi:nucleotide-binding universal stress UspA family protein